jgi:hypothetical protein
MPAYPLARCLPCLSLLVGAITGCQEFHDYRPVAIQALDAETKAPIAGANVRISYPLSEHALAPYDSLGTTDQEGIVRLRAAPYDKAGAQVEASAQGYLRQEKSLTADAVRAIEPPGWFEQVEQRPVSFVVELYAEPRPTVELIVPRDYRGLIKAHTHFREDIPCPKGQRIFRYEVRSTGEVDVSGPSLLMRLLPPDFHAVFADGTSLGPQPKDAEIGFWPLRTEGSTQYFWVGTRDQLDNFRRDEFARSVTTSQPASTPKAQGGGKHGRRGNPAPSDPSVMPAGSNSP